MTIRGRWPGNGRFSRPIGARHPLRVVQPTSTTSHVNSPNATAAAAALIDYFFTDRQRTVAQVATFTLTAVPGSSSIGAVTTVAQPADFTFEAVPGSSSLVGGASPQTTVAQVADFTLVAVPGASSTGPVTTVAQVATFTLAAVPGASSFGPVTTVAQVATFVLDAVPGVSSVGSVTTVAQPADFTLVAVPGVSSLSSGGGATQTTIAQPAEFVFVAVPGESFTQAPPRQPRPPRENASARRGVGSATPRKPRPPERTIKLNYPEPPTEISPAVPQNMDPAIQWEDRVSGPLFEKWLPLPTSDDELILLLA